MYMCVCACLSVYIHPCIHMSAFFKNQRKGFLTIKKAVISVISEQENYSLSGFELFLGGIFQGEKLN